MLEIYNECVQDLLADPSTRTTRGLSIWESKTMGVFVNGLSWQAVNSYEAIQNFMEIGNKNRSIGATEMNKISIQSCSYHHYDRVSSVLANRWKRYRKVFIDQSSWSGRIRTGEEDEGD